eukprot:Gb_31992 [translate_table: standard]
MGYLHSWSQDHHYQCHRRQNGGSRWKKASSFYCVLWTCVIIQQCWPLAALRPLRDKDVTSWGDQHLFIDRSENALGPYSMWNISGTYRGTWGFRAANNGSSRLPEFGKSNGQSVLELVSSPTKIYGVHYVQGAIIFRDGIHTDERDPQIIQMRMEGVYIWPFRQLRMVANSGTDGEHNQEDDFILSNPYHLLGIFSSQVLQESPRDQFRRKEKNALILDMERHCNLQIAAHISQISASQKNGEHEHYHMEGVVESPMIDDDGECFSPIILNATSINVEVYYNKAVNYTLMVTFVSFLCVCVCVYIFSVCLFCEKP